MPNMKPLYLQRGPIRVRGEDNEDHPDNQDCPRRKRVICWVEGRLKSLDLLPKLFELALKAEYDTEIK